MRRLVLLALLPAALAADAPLERLVALLGHEDPGLRAAATARLAQARDAAVPLLEQAQDDPDPEVRRRVRAILRGFETSWPLDLRYDRRRVRLELERTAGDALITVALSSSHPKDRWIEYHLQVERRGRVVLDGSGTMEVREEPYVLRPGHALRPRDRVRIDVRFLDEERRPNLADEFARVLPDRQAGGGR